MNWLHPLEATTFTALPNRRRPGRPTSKVKYKGKYYPSVVECAAEYGYSIKHMRKIMGRQRKRK